MDRTRQGRPGTLRQAKEVREQDKHEFAAVESELAMLAAQLAAIRKLRKK